MDFADVSWQELQIPSMGKINPIFQKQYIPQLGVEVSDSELHVLQHKTKPSAISAMTNRLLLRSSRGSYFPQYPNEGMSFLSLANFERFLLLTIMLYQPTTMV